MKKILMIADSDSKFAESILKLLQGEGGSFEVTRIESDHLIPESRLLSEGQFSCILFQCFKLDKTEFGFLHSLSALEPRLPILILSEQIDIYSYGQVHSMDNMVALQSPCDAKMLIAIVNKMAEGKNFKPERCPRFITNEPVRLVVLNTGYFIPTRMRNYSAGGAFLEYRGISMKVGDRIQLNLGQAKTRQKGDQLLLEGKVIWIRQGENARSPTRGVGIQFMEPEAAS